MVIDVGINGINLQRTLSHLYYFISQFGKTMTEGTPQIVD
jgi:hypothetical protein